MMKVQGGRKIMGENNANKSDAMVEEFMEMMAQGNRVEGSSKFVAYSQAITRVVNNLNRWNVDGLSDEEQENLAEQLQHLRDTLVTFDFVVSCFDTEEFRWTVDENDSSRRFCAVAKK